MQFVQLVDSYTGKTRSDAIYRADDKAFIPNDANNIDWQAYQAWLQAGNTPAPAAAPTPPVPQTISDRQFFQALAVMGTIAQSDAVAAVKTGTVPPPLQKLIDALPSDQQFGATMMIAGSTTFDRANSLTLQLGQAFGWNAAQLDALWTSASAI